MDVKGLTESQRDALAEVGNMGAGNAARALSQMIKKQIDVKIAEVDIVDIDKITSAVGGLDSQVTAVHLKMFGEATGNIILMFAKEDAFKLMDMVNSKPMGSTQIIDEYDSSALKEIGNILAGSYLTALADFLEIVVSPSIPRLHKNNKLSSIMDFATMKVSEDGDTKALLIKTEFNVANHETGGYFLVLFDQKSLGYMFNAISKKVE